MDAAECDCGRPGHLAGFKGAEGEKREGEGEERRGREREERGARREGNGRLTDAQLP